MSSCACGSNKDFTQCCRPFLDGSQYPTTAEECMRSRYTAFTEGNVDYIGSTHHESTKHEFNQEETQTWAQESEWKGLEILSTKKGQANDSEGIVEFRAHYSQQGHDVNHHELSQFKKEGDQWYFVDGQILRDPITRSQPKVGRNDPCTCGSGKKYKKCCGA